MSSAKPVGQTRDIQELFAGKVFEVPDYQRAFSWEQDPQLEDFWNDIKEAMQTRTEHYWGTVTLRSTGKCIECEKAGTPFKVFEIVDGQQRITTIYLFLLALSRKKPVIMNAFIRSEDIYRLKLGGLNDVFLKALVDGKDPQPDIKTNRLLKKAFGFFIDQLEAYIKQPSDVIALYQYLQLSTFSLEFTVPDETLAVKAFQSLNDRGKPLTLLDKTKSFFMFHSLRYLSNSLAPLINSVLGSIFMNYDIIRGIGEKEEIDYINSRAFSEDEVLRFFYHYFASYAISKYNLISYYDVDETADDVFKRF